MYTDYEYLKCEVEENILTIKLNRPDKLNALCRPMLAEIDKAFDQVYADPNVKGVIITGEGDKAFAAGADISEFVNIDKDNGRKMAQYGQSIFQKIESCPKPVIAGVNGYALGGGCELALACHMRVASKDAKFGQPEVNLGLIPGYGGTQRLAQLIGKAKAFELIMTGGTIDADTALKLGLVNYSVAPNHVMIKSKEILNIIKEKSPIAISQVAPCINAAFSEPQNGFSIEAERFVHCAASEDFIEGRTAFLEKRKPKFQGK